VFQLAQAAILTLSACHGSTGGAGSFQIDKPLTGKIHIANY